MSEPRYAELLSAIAFAAGKHRHQRRKDADATPYINHPLQLASLLANRGGVDDADTLMAAVLHDTVEDTETAHSELAAQFGRKVAVIVAALTDDKTLRKAERKQAQAALVKLADKTCNIRDVAASPPAGWPLERRQEYFDWARKVVDGLPPVSKRMRDAFDAAFAMRPEA